MFTWRPGLVEPQAEGVAGRVQAHAYVVLGLRLREHGPALLGVPHGTVEVGDPDVEVHLDRRLPRPARPHRPLEVHVLLEGDAQVVVAERR